MKAFCLCLARFCSAAWVGAATLFVVVAIRQVTSRQFATEVTDRLVLLRFPPYYLFGFVLLGTSLLATLGGGSLLRCRGRWITIGVSLALALALMAGDYIGIYQPLARLITPPGSSRPPEFERLHRLSEIINSVELLLVLGAALLLSWPAKACESHGELVALDPVPNQR